MIKTLKSLFGELILFPLFMLATLIILYAFSVAGLRLLLIAPDGLLVVIIAFVSFLIWEGIRSLQGKR